MSSVGPMHFAIMMEQLMFHSPITRVQLIEATGFHEVTISRYCEKLRSKRVIRICGWERASNRNWMPQFEVNADGLPDVQRPKPIPKKHLRAQFRSRLKAIEMNRRMAG